MFRVPRSVADEQAIIVSEFYPELVDEEVHIPGQNSDGGTSFNQTSDLGILDTTVHTEDLNVSLWGWNKCYLKPYCNLAEKWSRDIWLESKSIVQMRFIKVHHVFNEKEKNKYI